MGGDEGGVGRLGFGRQAEEDEDEGGKGVDEMGWVEKGEVWWCGCIWDRMQSNRIRGWKTRDAGENTTTLMNTLDKHHQFASSQPLISYESHIKSPCLVCIVTTGIRLKRLSKKTPSLSNRMLEYVASVCTVVSRWSYCRQASFAARSGGAWRFLAVGDEADGVVLGTDGAKEVQWECEGGTLTIRTGRGPWDHGGPCGHSQVGHAPPRFSNLAVACTGAS